MGGEVDGVSWSGEEREAIFSSGFGWRFRCKRGSYFVSVAEVKEILKSQ